MCCIWLLEEYMNWNMYFRGDCCSKWVLVIKGVIVVNWVFVIENFVYSIIKFVFRFKYFWMFFLMLLFEVFVLYDDVWWKNLILLVIWWREMRCVFNIFVYWDKFVFFYLKFCFVGRVKFKYSFVCFILRLYYF